MFKKFAQGEPARNLYLSEDNDLEIAIGWILPPFDFKDQEGIVATTETARKHQELPQDYVPSPATTATPIYFASVLNGQVVYWPSDDPDVRERLVCESVPALMAGLEDFE